MKKIFSVLLMVFFLAGCGAFDTSHYQGVVVKVSATSFMVCPCEGDPAADYPIYEIFVMAGTEVTGDRASFADMKQGDEVKVWVANEKAAELAAERISVKKGK